MTRPCAAASSGDPDACSPGWRQVPPELRRVLADTLAEMLDDVPGGRAAHDRAHAAAVAFRAGSRPRDAAVDYRRIVRGAVRQQIRSAAA